MNQLISIIVPVYNVKNYLVACIDSILNQAYAETEIILVDDGSNDGSGKLCDVYAEKNDKIVVIHQSNAGTAEARNAGLRVARGEYIAFVDSDDIINKYFLLNMLTVLCETGADMAQCTMFRFVRDREVSIIVNSQKNEHYELISAKQAHVQMYGDEGMTYGVVCNKLFKRQKFIEVFFQSDKMNEDTYWISEAYILADKIAITQAALYYYRYVKGSKQHSKVTEKNYAIIDFYNEFGEYFRTHGEEELFCSSKQHCLRVVSDLYRQAILSKANRKVVEYFYDTVRDVYFELNGRNSLGKKEKFKYYFFVETPRAYVVFAQMNKYVERVKRKIRKCFGGY